MKDRTDILNYDDPPWDIPVLSIKPQTRQKLLEHAIETAKKEGFILPIPNGLLLAWKDLQETNWYGGLTFRVWVCCNTSITKEDMICLSSRLIETRVKFAAISSWLPFPECKGFIDVGASIYTLIDRLRDKISFTDSKNIKIHLFGEVPNRWIDVIVNHVGKSTWRDRHAKDKLLDPEKVKQRRTCWIRKQLISGDGFLVSMLNMKKDIGAYLVVPLDRSRHPYGGPVVAGINAVAGSIEEGRGFARKTILAALNLTKSLWDTAIIQYQPDNKVMSCIMNRTFFFKPCIRYDIHWHGD